ncbi:hypothetical protein SUDANB6_00010 [Streptomyces sp. enrichment culture]
MRISWWGVASPPTVVVRPGFSTIQGGGLYPASPAGLPRPRRQPLYTAAPGPASYGSPSGRVSPSSSTTRRPGSVSSNSQKSRQSSHRYSNTPTPTSTAPCGHRVPSPRPTHSHSLTSPIRSTVRPPRPPQGVGPQGRTGVHSRHHASAPASSPTSTPARHQPGSDLTSRPARRPSGPPRTPPPTARPASTRPVPRRGRPARRPARPGRLLIVQPLALHGEGGAMKVEPAFERGALVGVQGRHGAFDDGHRSIIASGRIRRQAGPRNGANVACCGTGSDAF